MFQIFKYKKLYEDMVIKNKELEKEKKNAQDNDLETTIKLSQTENELKNTINNYENKINNYESKINLLEKNIQHKEILRRKVAGKVGGLTRYNNKLLSEKSDMMQLINNLIEENQKLKNSKKRPNINEIKKYFKK